MGKTKGFLENRLSFSISLDEDFELSKTPNNPRILLRRRLYTPPFRGMYKKPHHRISLRAQIQTETCGYLKKGWVSLTTHDRLLYLAGVGIPKLSSEASE